MKKVLTLVAVAGMFTFVACGPSAAEKEAKAKATADSIAAIEATATEAAKAQAIADSTATAVAAEEAKAKATADSIAVAEEAAKAKKGGKSAAKPKTNQQQMKENVKELNKDRG
jgi:hypothetical protein